MWNSKKNIEKSRNKTARKIQVKARIIFYTVLHGERRNFPEMPIKAEKTPLFSRVLAFFVSRETDAENQIVPRET